MTATTTENRYREKVEAGAAWLDESVPGWRERIHLDRLDLAECDRCIVGQVFGPEARSRGFLDGYEFVVSSHGAAKSFAWVLGHGFSIGGEPGFDDELWAELAAAWLDVLRSAP